MVFPRSNLPNDSVPWGRQVQNEIEELKRIYGSVEEDVLSDNRAFAGQLGVLGRQIEELRSRSVSRYDVPDISVSRSSGSGWGSTTQPVTLLGVGDSSRWAYVSFSAIVKDQSVLEFMQAGASLVTGNTVVGRQIILDLRYAPSWYHAAVSFGALVNIPASGREFTISVDGQVLSGGTSRTLTLTDIEITVMFSDKI